MSKGARATIFDKWKGFPEGLDFELSSLRYATKKLKDDALV
jgi:hypothetical protein